VSPPRHGRLGVPTLVARLNCQNARATGGVGTPRPTSPEGLLFGAHSLACRCVLCLLNGCARRGQRGTQIRFGGTGLMMCASGTLNGSSPTANLASANIKGKWVVFHFAGHTRTGQRSYPEGQLRSGCTVVCLLL